MITHTHRYVSEIVPMICEPGDDEQHGSSVVCDVNALQALSRRVHLGKFVAESKFQVHMYACIAHFYRGFAWWGRVVELSVAYFEVSRLFRSCIISRSDCARKQISRSNMVVD